MEVKTQIAQLLVEAFKSRSIELEVGSLRNLIETPKDSALGDHAFPCFTLSKSLKEAPQKIAQSILPELIILMKRYPELDRVVAAGPYLNFFQTASAMANIVSSIIDEDELAPFPATGEKVMIEYSQPNTHKAFHVGHMRNVALGDSLVRLYEYGGHHVTAANYIGDEGAHIAKCLWIYQSKSTLTIPDENKGEFLGSLYREADLALDFKQLTDFPLPGLLSAKVIEKQTHPSNATWQIVKLEVGREFKQVVCGGKGYQVGSIVAYAQPGTKVAGRLVEAKQMQGTHSEGMICSEVELSLGKDRDKIHEFSQGTTSGQLLTELGRKANALPPEREVAAEMEDRLKQVSKVLQALEDKSHPIQNLWHETRQWSLDDFKAIYEWIDCRFDHYFYESEVGDQGKKMVLDAYERGLLEKSEGTIGVDLSADKLGYLMLLKSDGTGLYATKDLALAKRKFEEFKIDRSIYVVDYSQSLHFAQVFRALDLFGYPQAKKCFHLAYGLVTIPGGKMSSRKGTVIFFSELKRQLMNHIKKEHLSKHDDAWSNTEKETSARKIAIATIKYGMLNQDNLKNIVFDMDEWTSLSGNTGPYLLYAYARTQSIQRRIGTVATQEFQGDLLTHPDERAVLTALSQFKIQVQRSLEQNKPQLICIYLYGLSRDFSRMFENCPVAKAENDQLRYSRLMLVKATGMVLQKGLSLLGIQTLEQM